MTTRTTAFELQNIRLRRSEESDLETVRDLLIQGFWENPAYGLIDLHDNLDAERFVFDALTKLIVRRGHSYIIYHNDDIVGHVQFVPPNAPVDPSTWDSIRVGWQIPFRFGVGFTRRLVNFIDAIDTQTNEHLGPYQPAAMLDWFTIKNEWRNSGIGLHVLNEFVAKNHARVLLMTEVEKTLPLYKRGGFEIIAAHKLRTGYDRECDSWCLVYNAPSK